MSGTPDPYLSPEASGSGPSGTSGKAIASLVLGIGSFFCSLLFAIPALILGLMGLGDINRSQGKLSGRGMATTGIVLSIVLPMMQFIFVILLALLLPAIQAAREAARRASSSVKLKNVVIAAHMYHDNFQKLPVAADSSKGAPVSWRTKLLPYVEQGHLYDQYDHSQPWDSAANRAISDKKVPVYQSPNARVPDSNQTNYLAVVGPGTVFEGNQPISFNTVKAPTQTIFYVEANHDRTVPWAEPKDLDYDPANPRAGLGDVRPGLFIAAFGGSEVRSINNDIDPDVLRAMMSRDPSDNGGIERELNKRYGGGR